MAVLGFHSFSEFVVYLTFLFFGVSVMLVSSAISAALSFITAYYKYAQGKPDVEAEDPVFWANVLTYFNVAVFVMQVLCEAFVLAPFGRCIPLRPRLTAGLLIPLVEVLILILVLVGKTSEAGAKATIVVIAIVSGLSKTLCDSSTTALAALFPTKFFGAFVWGLGVSGIISSALSIIIKASMPNDFYCVLTQSRIYFGVTMGFQLFSCILLVVMPRIPLAREYTAEFRYVHDHRKQGHAPDDERADSSEEAKEASMATLEYTTESADPGNGTNVLNAEGDADNVKDTDQVDNITSTQQMLSARIWTLLVRVCPMLLSCFIVFGATLQVFPGVFFAVKSDNEWYTTIIVAMFNVGDFVGRFFLLFKLLQPLPRVVLAGTFLRLLAIPPLVLCVCGIIPCIALPYILCLIWGTTGGYFGGKAMIYGPRTPSLTMAGQRSLAAIMVELSLQLGLFIGSSLALAVKKEFPA
ncbi:Equilibrative nucleoside transporter [Trypanosoma melophagium]|uniref:Equilibrative nucleoside transporter n=1 Tax=Trypanosoma melophagium TaxID=715481 RepID=UPI00351A7A00|nr:Equilibrative nucleoside transporter [Trypanosoma melophagium]